MFCSSAGAIRFPFPCLFTVTLGWIRSFNPRGQSSYFSPDCPPVSSFPSSPVGSINMSALDLAGQFALCTTNLKWGQKIHSKKHYKCAFLSQQWGQETTTGRSFSSVRVAPMENGVEHARTRTNIHTHTHKAAPQNKAIGKKWQAGINNPSPKCHPLCLV